MSVFFNISASIKRTSYNSVEPIPVDNPVMIVMVGESNSGGQVNISNATTLEKTPNPDVQLLDVVNLDKFYPLELGVNQNLGHTGLSPTMFGWHNQIGNRMRNETFVESPVYLVETGHGGSRLSQWASGSNYYNIFTQRVSTAINLIQQQTGKAPVIYYMYTHGINDRIAGITAANLKTQIIDLWSRIYDDFGVATVLFPELMDSFANEPTRSEYKDMFIELQTEIQNFYLIDSTSATTQDSYHWSYQGMNLLADRMLNKILELRL